MAEAAYYQVVEEPVPVILAVDRARRLDPVRRAWIGEVPAVSDVLEAVHGE